MTNQKRGDIILMQENVALTITLACLASGGVGVALMGILKDYLNYRREKKIKLNNEKIERFDKIEQIQSAQSEALKFLLYDRIRYLGQTYIFAGEIDIDDQKILHDMHKSYKKNGGNGDLEPLMHQIDNLPLKIKKDRSIDYGFQKFKSL